LYFVKTPGCAQHYRKHLDEVGLAGLLEKSSWLIDRLAEDGEVIELKPHDDHWDYTFRHPMIEHFVSGGVFPEEDSADPKVDPQRAVAEAVFKKYSAHLVSDVHTAKRFSTPLAASVSLHAEVLDRSIPEAAEAEIALNLALPVLEDVPAAELIRVRQAEALSFERFRQSLRLAIQDLWVPESRS
jgi:hypothetical protein